MDAVIVDWQVEHMGKEKNFRVSTANTFDEPVGGLMNALLTSNRSPAEWYDLFGDPLLASAGLDRLAHDANVLFIQGESYRAKDRRQLLKEEVKVEKRTRKNLSEG